MKVLLLHIRFTQAIIFKAGLFLVLQLMAKLIVYDQFQRHTLSFLPHLDHHFKKDCSYLFIWIVPVILTASDLKNLPAFYIQ